MYNLYNHTNSWTNNSPKEAAPGDTAIAGNLITPIGTGIGQIVKQFIGDVDSRVLINSLLTGLSVEHHTHSIDRGTVCLIAVKENDERGKMVFTKPGSNFHSYSKSFTASLNSNTEMACDTNIKGEHRPCINCGYCQDVCPVNLSDLTWLT